MNTKSKRGTSQNWCESCGALGPTVDSADIFEADELADAAWNNRPSETEPAAELISAILYRGDLLCVAATDNGEVMRQVGNLRKAISEYRQRASALKEDGTD